MSTPLQMRALLKSSLLPLFFPPRPSPPSVSHVDLRPHPQGELVLHPGHLLAALHSQGPVATGGMDGSDSSLLVEEEGALFYVEHHCA